MPPHTDAAAVAVDGNDGGGCALLLTNFAPGPVVLGAFHGSLLTINSTCIHTQSFVFRNVYFIFVFFFCLLLFVLVYPSVDVYRVRSRSNSISFTKILRKRDTRRCDGLRV